MTLFGTPGARRGWARRTSGGRSTAAQPRRAAAEQRPSGRRSADERLRPIPEDRVRPDVRVARRSRRSSSISVTRARQARSNLISSIYFTVETIATVGFGDFSYGPARVVGDLRDLSDHRRDDAGDDDLRAADQHAGQPPDRAVARSGADPGDAGTRRDGRPRGRRDAGARRARRQDRDVVVVERDEGNRYLNQVRNLGVPLVLGDSTLGQTLDSVNLATAASVAIVTSNDMTNIETGLAVRDRLGQRWVDVPVILRVFDRDLGSRLRTRSGSGTCGRRLRLPRPGSSARRWASTCCSASMSAATRS